MRKEKSCGTGYIYTYLHVCVFFWVWFWSFWAVILGWCCCFVLSLFALPGFSLSRVFPFIQGCPPLGLRPGFGPFRPLLHSPSPPGGAVLACLGFSGVLLCFGCFQGPLGVLQMLKNGFKKYKQTYFLTCRPFRLCGPPLLFCSVHFTPTHKITRNILVICVDVNVKQHTLRYIHIYRYTDINTQQQ